jgi:hypothetical protein
MYIVPSKQVLQRHTNIIHQQLSKQVLQNYTNIIHQQLS